jgi:protein SCO1/2
MLWLVDFKRSYRPPLPVIGPVADFALTNQDGQLTTVADFSNHVWVADIIFTRCAGPCPRMTGQMRALQNLLPPEDPARFVTLTTDPEYDTPAVLKKYGERFNADFRRWTFLTGTKQEIAALASGSLKLSAVPVKPEEQKDAADLFIHTTIFVVVDQHAQLRASFETGGDGVDWTNDVAPRLLKTIRQLENEP